MRPHLGLEDLPDELLTMVLEHTDKQTNLNATLVSKGLVGPAQSLLYEKIIVISENQDASAAHFTLILLIRTLSEQPRLASLVRHFRMCNWYQLEEQRPMDKSLFYASALLEDCPSAWIVPEFRKQLMQCSFDALLTLTIALMPKLSHLAICPSPYRPDAGDAEFFDDFSMEYYLEPEYWKADLNECLFVDIMQWNAQNQRLNRDTAVFSNLVHVSLDGRLGYDDGADLQEQPDVSWDFRIVSIFLSLPSLRSFTGRGCSVRESTGAWICRQRSSNVKDLTLEDCHFSTDEIRLVLDSCTCLESLSLDLLCGLTRVRENVDDLFLDEVRPSLEYHRLSLRRVRFRFSGNGYAVDDCHGGVFGDLARYDCLNKLDVHDVEIMGDEEYTAEFLVAHLPPNLQTLLLEVTTRGKDDVPQALAKLFGRSGALRKVTLSMSHASSNLYICDELEAQYPHVKAKKLRNIGQMELTRRK